MPFNDSILCATNARHPGATLTQNIDNVPDPTG